MSRHFLNTKRLSPAGNEFTKTGRYCSYPKNTALYYEFWDEEKKRCLEGFTTAEGDISITGFHYFYLNYTRIQRVKSTTRPDGTVHSERIEGFPAFYDTDFHYFQAVETCRITGKHLAVLKARRKGFSYKAASMMNRNYFLVRHSKNFVFASLKEYLTGVDAILTKTFEMMSFIDDNTAWSQPRSLDRPMEKTSGYRKRVNGQWVQKGFLSSIAGVSLKDDPEKVKGKAGELIFFEEAGSFPELQDAWAYAMPTMRQGDRTLGTMIAFGCLTENNDVITADGRKVSIKDLKQEDGILGYSTNTGISEEPIVWMQPPAEKPCVRLTTNTGRHIECSTDHPILWGRQNFGSRPRVKGSDKRVFVKKMIFKEAKDIVIGDQVAVADVIGRFGNKVMWSPRLVGLLIGDGSYGFDKTPILSNADPEVNEYVYSNFSAVRESGYITKDGREYKETRIREICPKLRELGIYGQTKEKKRLPDNLFSYRDEDVREMIGGLFDADGYVQAREVGPCEVSLSSTSKEMLLEVLHVMNRWGIHGRIQTIKQGLSPKSTKNHYRYIISDSLSLSRFKEQIHFLTKRKQDRLEEIAIAQKWSGRKSSKEDGMQGIRVERVVKIENVGIMPIYNLTAGKTHTYLANGIVTHNTGGTSGSGFECLDELFYHPEAYDCLSFPNEWSESSLGTECGFFVPIYHILEGFIDDDGNSIAEDARDFEIKERNKKRQGNDPKAYDTYIAEHPFSPEEATLQVSANILNQATLKEQYDRTKVHNLTALGVPGELVPLNGKVNFQPNWELKPILKFPHRKGDDITGCVIVYEKPFTQNGDVPDGLYFICHDPYAQDQATSSSLGAAYVLKRPNKYSQPDDMIVASYVGRPATQDTYNYTLFNLATFYNAKIGFENDRGDVIGYAKRFRRLNQLQPQFEMLQNKDLQSKTVDRGFGMHMTEQRKNQGMLMWRDWLDCKRGRALDDSYTLNVHKIYDPALLQESMKFNNKGNFDRCLSAGTQLQTINGLVAIEDVVEGELVLTHKGRYKPVTRKTYHLSEKMTEVYVVGQPDPLACTNDHPILVSHQKKRNGNRHWKYEESQQFEPAEGLVPIRDYVFVPKRKEIKPELSSEEAYVVGWYIGDGYLHNDLFTIVFSKKEFAQAQKVAEIIDRLHITYDLTARKGTKKTCTIKDSGTYYRLSKTSKYVARLFRKYGGTANNKHYKLNCIYSAIGLIEAEGHLKKTPREAIEVGMNDENIIKHLRQVLIDHGIW